MALERVGIGGILKFSADAAITGMKRAGKGFTELKKRASAVGGGMSKVASGAAGVTAGLAATGVAVAFMAGSAANFEAQMSAVNSILDETNREKLPELTALAKKMGAETVFSATQAGQGIEAMARSGANAADIMAGLGGVLNAAAADGIDLGTASSIVSNIVNAMGLTFEDATRVADVLAKTSSKSNTNILALGESFKFAAAQSSKMGIDLETTATALGAIADSGLKGTLGGTSFANMLVKLSKPSKKATDQMNKWGIKLTDADGKMRDIFEITKDFKKGLSGIKDEVERASLATEIFGIRGDKAFNALSKSLDKTGPKNLLALRDAIRDSAGAAEEMAKLRLDNLLGSFTLFKSAAEGLFIEVFTPFLPFLKSGMDAVTKSVQGVVRGLQILSGKPTDDNVTAWKEMGKTTKSVVLGIRDGLRILTDGWFKFTDLVKKGVDLVKSRIGGDGVRMFTKLGVIIGIATAALSPLLIALGLVVILIGSTLIPIVSGLGAIFAAVGKPLLIAATIGLLAWKLFGAEIMDFISGIRIGLIPLIGVLKQSWADLSNAIGIAFVQISMAIGKSTSGIVVNWKTVGEVVGLVLVTIIGTLSDIVVGAILIGSAFTKFVLPVGKMIFKAMFLPMRQVFELMFNIKDAIGEVFEGNFIRGLARVGAAIFDFMLKPLRTALEIFGLMGSAVGFEMPDALKKFASDGITGLAFGPSDSGASPAAASQTSPKKAPSPAAKATAESAKNSKEADKTMEALKDAIRALPEKQKIDIQNNLCIDGREVAIASEKHKVELQERAGFKATPWQRRMAVEAGGVPVAAAG